jgi:spore coat protein U-like protein
VGNDFSGEDSMNKAIRLVAAGALLAAGVPLSASAQTATITINAQVNSQCNFSNVATPAFAINPLDTTTTSYTGTSLSLTCNRGAAVTIAMNDGSNSIAAGAKRLKKTTAAEFINYNLSQPVLPLAAAGNSCPTTLPGTEWTAAISATPMFASSGGVRTIPLCISVPGSQDPSTGSWQDVVTATFIVS